MLSSKIRRIFAVLLLAVMIFSSLTINVFANNTVNERADIIKIAKSEIGYTGNADGTTKYDKFINTNENRSAAFLAWCASKASISEKTIPNSDSPSAFREFFEEKSSYYRSSAHGGGYTPFMGDIVFFTSSGSLLNIGRLGLIAETDENNIYVVEYGANGKVQLNTYSLTDKDIAGFAAVKYKHFYFDGSVKPEHSDESLYLVADISNHNAASKFKWDKFTENGVDGVIIRIAGRGYGDEKTLYEDASFLAHYNAAKKAGLHIGVYFFSYALTKAQALEEAQMTINMLQKENIELDMPVFIDIEDYAESNYTDYQHYKAGKTVCTNVVNTFCDAIERAGYYPGIYCNKYFAENLLEPSVFENRATWIAQYGVSECGYKGDIDMWQYTNNGKISAFSGAIDLSYCYTDFPSLINPDEDTPNKFGEHIISDTWKITQEGDCLTNGERVKTCVDCNKILVIEKISGSHAKSEECVFVHNTDISAGDTLTEEQLNSLISSREKNYYLYYDIYTFEGGTLLTYCTLCNKVLSTNYSYPFERHNGNNTKTSEPTCVSEGKTVVTCSDCGITMTEELLAKTEHTDFLKVTSKKNCTADEQKEITCSVCKTVFKTELMPTYAHKYSKTSAVSKATLFSSGKDIYTCETCSHSFTEETPAPIYGDADLNGEITTADARLALRVAVELEKIQYTSFVAADINNSGDITTVDARLILRFAVGLDKPEDTMKIYYKR